MLASILRSADGIGSAESSTNTNMQLELHGRSFRPLITAIVP